MAVFLEDKPLSCLHPLKQSFEDPCEDVGSQGSVLHSHLDGAVAQGWPLSAPVPQEYPKLCVSDCPLTCALLLPLLETDRGYSRAVSSEHFDVYRYTETHIYIYMQGYFNRKTQLHQAEMLTSVSCVPSRGWIKSILPKSVWKLYW